MTTNNGKDYKGLLERLTNLALHFLRDICELWEIISEEIISVKYTMTAIYPRNSFILQYCDKRRKQLS